MSKYLVETYYTCNFKVKHYLDELNEEQLSKLDKREDGKFEISEHEKNEETGKWEMVNGNREMGKRQPPRGGFATSWK